MYLLSDQDGKDLERTIIESDSNKHSGSKIWSLFKLAYGQLLKSSLGLLARYCIYQETISGQLNKSIFHLTKIGIEPLFESDSNKRRETKMQSLFKLSQTIIEVRSGALGQILHPPGDH